MPRRESYASEVDDGILQNILVCPAHDHVQLVGNPHIEVARSAVQMRILTEVVGVLARVSVTFVIEDHQEAAVRLALFRIGRVQEEDFFSTQRAALGTGFYGFAEIDVDHFPSGFPAFMIAFCQRDHFECHAMGRPLDMLDIDLGKSIFLEIGKAVGVCGRIWRARVAGEKMFLDVDEGAGWRICPPGFGGAVQGSRPAGNGRHSGHACFSRMRSLGRRLRGDG